MSQLIVYLTLALLGGWTLTNPMIGLGTYYFFAFARPHDMYWWWNWGRFSFVIGLLVCGVWLYRRLEGRAHGPVRSPINVLVLVFFALKVCSAFFAADQAAAWFHVNQVSKIVVFYFLTVSMVDTGARLRGMCLVTMASLAALGVWGNWQWYVEGVRGGELGELAGPGWEIGSTFTDRNLFGYMLACGVPFCILAAFIERRPLIRWPALGCVPILMNAVMLTFGRAAFLGMLVGAGCSVIRLRRLMPVIGCAVVGLLIVYRLAGADVLARMATIEAYDQDQSALGRLESWKAGWAMIADHPILGVGPDNYGRYSYVYNPKVRRATDDQAGLVAHNEFIQTAGETGIPSAIVQITMILLAFGNVRRIRRAAWSVPHLRWAYYYAAMIESSLLTYLVVAMFASLPYFELSYLLIALTVCLRRIVEQAAGETTETSPARVGRRIRAGMATA